MAEPLASGRVILNTGGCMRARFALYSTHASFKALLILALVSAGFPMTPVALRARPLGLSNSASPSHAVPAQAPGNTPGDPSSHAQASAPSSRPGRVTLPAGTIISVRIADEVDSSHGKIGDLYTGSVDPSVLIGNQVAIPRGTEAHMRMVEDKKGGHLHGKAEVELELDSLVINGQKLDVESDSFKKQQGAIAARAGAVAKPAAGAAASAAADSVTAASPGGAVLEPAIAVFHSAKVKVPAGTRVPFNLNEDFTFTKPS